MRSVQHSTQTRLEPCLGPSRKGFSLTIRDQQDQDRHLRTSLPGWRSTAARTNLPAPSPLHPSTVTRSGLHMLMVGSGGLCQVQLCLRVRTQGQLSFASITAIVVQSRRGESKACKEVILKWAKHDQPNIKWHVFLVLTYFLSVVT